MSRHKLKIKTEYFNAVITGDKTFEIRLNDRDYKLWDILDLFEYDDDYTGASCSRVVTYILYGGQFGLDKNYVIMALGET